MKKRKQFALNRLFNTCIMFGLISALLALGFFSNGELAWGIGHVVAALLLIVLPAIFTPCCYAFDSEGVSLCYIFLPVERYLWKNIHAIEVLDKGIGHKRILIDLIWVYVFEIYGDPVGKERFYMNGHIRKSLRTKHLIEKYWDGTVTGYLFDDMKKWLNKRKAKKQAHIEAHFADEIVITERETRAEVRRWIAPIKDRARLSDIKIKTDYIYVTNDFKQLHSRPAEGYTYTFTAEIAHNGETDEERIYCVSVDLLYVRLGKTAYRGVKNDSAKETLESELSKALDELIEN